MDRELLNSEGRRKSWKSAEVKKKWHSILAVFITVTLLFAIVNGLVKGFSFKDRIGKSSWDGKSSFIIAIDSSNPSVFIYQPDPKRVAVLTLSGDTIYETGSFREPLAKISERAQGSSGDLTTSLSHAYRAKVGNYINLSKKVEVERKFAENMLLDFASLSTPLKLLSGGWTENIKETNITRTDALRLWWQVKSLSINNLILADLSKYTEEILNKDNEKILGADTASLNRVIAKYTENLKVLEEKYDVKVANGTNTAGVARLASDFIESVGGNVAEINRLETRSDVSKIIAPSQNSYTANYLANIFDCDITEAESGQDAGEITVLIGNDFAKQYFK